MNFITNLIETYKKGLEYDNLYAELGKTIKAHDEIESLYFKEQKQFKSCIFDLEKEIKKLKEENEIINKHSSLENFKKFTESIPKTPTYYDFGTGRKQVHTIFKESIKDKEVILDFIENDLKFVMNMDWTVDDLVFNFQRILNSKYPTTRYYDSDISLYNKNEYWATAKETIIKLKAGTKAYDCLFEDTLLLTDDLEFVKIKDIKKGDKIIGKKGKPVIVLNKWKKGLLSTYCIKLNNHSEIIATEDHQFFLKDGSVKTLKELKLKDSLLVPKIITCDDCEEDDVDFWKLYGLYLADGWRGEYDWMNISGRDGHPKEKQKEWIKNYAEKKGWKYKWEFKSIRIKNKDFSDLCKKSGHTAVDKFIYKMPKNSINAEALIEGLNADSGLSKGGSRTYSTISYKLALQYRVLLQMLGFRASITKVLNHGGLGNNPIYRVFVQEKRLMDVKIESIIKIDNKQVYDIETSDGGIYLPENQVVVHNCDDKMTLIYACLFHLIQIYFPNEIWRLRGFIVDLWGNLGGHALLGWVYDKYNDWIPLETTFLDIQQNKLKNYRIRDQLFYQIRYSFDNKGEYVKI